MASHCRVQRLRGLIKGEHNFCKSSDVQRCSNSVWTVSPRLTPASAAVSPLSTRTAQALFPQTHLQLQGFVVDLNQIERLQAVFVILLPDNTWTAPRHILPDFKKRQVKIQSWLQRHFRAALWEMVYVTDVK